MSGPYDQREQDRHHRGQVPPNKQSIFFSRASQVPIQQATPQAEVPASTINSRNRNQASLLDYIPASQREELLAQERATAARHQQADSRDMTPAAAIENFDPHQPSPWNVTPPSYPGGPFNHGYFAQPLVLGHDQAIGSQPPLTPTMSAPTQGPPQPPPTPATSASNQEPSSSAAEPLREAGSDLMATIVTISSLDHKRVRLLTHVVDGLRDQVATLKTHVSQAERAYVFMRRLYSTRSSLDNETEMKRKEDVLRNTYPSDRMSGAIEALAIETALASGNIPRLDAPTLEPIQAPESVSKERARKAIEDFVGEVSEDLRFATGHVAGAGSLMSQWSEFRNLTRQVDALLFQFDAQLATAWSMGI